ncbi:hypothetical protein C4A74_03302 [Escherichia coli]|nr:hypothetical protein C4A72_03172 [Escherichia coli]RDO52423.1 hypothetical protein C4A74_03302 [Escherichia coli]
MLVTVTGHNTKVPAVSFSPAPLCNVSPQLNNITVTLCFQLACTITPAVMSPFVAHPHAGIFRLTGHDIGVLHRPQTFMKTGHEHGVYCSHIGRIGTGFRTKIIIITTRCRFRFRVRVRRRCWFRRIFTAGQIPVTTVASLTTPQRVVISTGSYTTSLNEFSTVGVTVDMNQFNTIECLCSCTASISNCHTGLTGCITFNHQFIRCGGVISQNCVHEQRAVITGVVAANSQHIARSISSQVKSAAVGHIPGDTTKASKNTILFNIDLAAGEHDGVIRLTQNQCACINISLPGPGSIIANGQ